MNIYIEWAIQLYSVSSCGDELVYPGELSRAFLLFFYIHVCHARIKSMSDSGLQELSSLWNHSVEFRDSEWISEITNKINWWNFTNIRREYFWQSGCWNMISDAYRHPRLPPLWPCHIDFAIAWSTGQGLGLTFSCEDFSGSW